MSRTKKGSKGAGYEYWSARPGNKGGGNGLGKDAKKLTHKRERAQQKDEDRRQAT